VFRAAVLALGQFADPPLQRLMLRCAGLALAVFVVLLLGITLVFANVDLTGIDWLDVTLGYAGPGVAFLVALLLFPGAVTVTLNLFAEQVAELVERRHYPELPPARPVPLAEATWAGIRLALITIVLNLLALPFYFLLPGANLAIFLALNGYLLGREYFELVAQRRLPATEARRLQRQLRFRIWAAGAIIAMTLTIPVFNLVAPVAATAFMVHVFERWRGGAEASGAVAAVAPSRDGSR
jgi:uncharacterized protein involved in cysteine biosynthesis